MPAGLDDVGMPAERPVAGARRQQLHHRLLEERDGSLGPQRGEGPVDDVGRLRPEVEVREVDLVERGVWQFHRRSVCENFVTQQVRPMEGEQ